MKVITPVGTSIFTNYFDTIKNKTIKDKYSFIVDQEKDTNADNLEQWHKNDLSYIENSVAQWAKGNIKNASAELSSLFKLKEEYDQLDVFLIATDTVFSPIAACILENIVQDIDNINIARTDIVSGLQVTNPDKFKSIGVPNLIEKLDDIIGAKPEEAILNITGGFKSVIPFITIYGQIKPVRTCYLYEDAEELIWMPEIPIYFDFSDVEDYYTAFEAARKNEQNLVTKDDFLSFIDNDPKAAENKFNDFLERQIFCIKEDKVKLDAYGEILFKYHKKSQGIDVGTHIGDYMELKLHEYFSSKFSSLEISRNVHFDDPEADLFIVDEATKQVTIIECKSGGNIPFKDIEEQKIGKLLPLVINKYQNYSIRFHVYLYHSRQILDCLTSKMQRLIELAKTKGVKMSWYWIETEKFSLSKISQDKVKCILEEN